LVVSAAKTLNPPVFWIWTAVVELVLDLAIMLEEALLVVSVILPVVLPVLSATLPLPPFSVSALELLVEPIVTVSTAAELLAIVTVLFKATAAVEPIVTTLPEVSIPSKFWAEAFWTWNAVVELLVSSKRAVPLATKVPALLAVGALVLSPAIAASLKLTVAP